MGLLSAVPFYSFCLNGFLKYQILLLKHDILAWSMSAVITAFFFLQQVVWAFTILTLMMVITLMLADRPRRCLALLPATVVTIIIIIIIINIPVLPHQISYAVNNAILNCRLVAPPFF
jgi:hypothetical protein